VIRVVLVDDHPVVRRGLRETLSVDPGIAVVAEAAQSEEVLGTLAAHRCDVLLLDISLPGRGGIEVLKDVRRECPSTKVLIVSTHDEAQYAVRAVRAGAAGYLTKSSSPEELVRAVRTVAATGHYYTDSVAAALASFTVQDRTTPAHERLSDREHEVLRLLTEGLTISDIAVRLSLSVKTVSTYRTRLAEKLGVRTTAELVRYALEHKLFNY
jgi:two-component system invasion response regulator UvrY